MFNQISLAASFHKCLGNLNIYGSEPMLLKYWSHLIWVEKSFLLSKCINMSSWVCIAPVVFLLVIVFPSVVVCASVDRGVEELLQYFDDPYFFVINKASVNPLLCASLLTYVSLKYFSTIILHSIPMSFGSIRVSYQLHKLLVHYMFPFLISIGLLWWPE